MQISPISFTSITKVHAPLKVSEHLCNLAKNSGIKDVMALPDSKNSHISYILTEDDYIKADKIYAASQSETDKAYSYYGAGETALISGVEETINSSTQNQIDKLLTQKPHHNLFVDIDETTGEINSLNLKI